MNDAGSRGKDVFGTDRGVTAAVLPPRSFRATMYYLARQPLAPALGRIGIIPPGPGPETKDSVVGQLPMANLAPRRRRAAVSPV